RLRRPLPRLVWLGGQVAVHVGGGLGGPGPGADVGGRLDEDATRIAGAAVLEVGVVRHVVTTQLLPAPHAHAASGRATRRSGSESSGPRAREEGRRRGARARAWTRGLELMRIGNGLGIRPKRRPTLSRRKT